jgi:hypothetical protein
MLYPAYKLRGTFRGKILGEKFWSMHEKKRTATYGERYWPAVTILNFGGDQNEMQAQEDLKHFAKSVKAEVVMDQKKKE